jgi:cyclic 2,3-diphosphoglycerate synthase
LSVRTAVVLVDGEHYPPVIRAALQELAGTRALAALFLGGTEKVDEHGAEVDLGVPVRWAERGADVAAWGATLTNLIAEHRPDVVVDLSDEPVLDQRRRTHLASYALLAGVPYEGPDFRFDPPPRPRLARWPSMAVISTGKRTGKTAVAGAIARGLAQDSRAPVVVAMGRGGPPEPVVIAKGETFDAARLLTIADEGGHAASDFYEDAVTSGVATVGARRCGGGLAGAVAHSNVADAIAAAHNLDGDFLILEGSGAAIPPAHADATVLVVPGHCDPEFVRGYLGPFRILLADLVVVTMAESPSSTPDQVEGVLGAIGSISRRPSVVRTVFRPHPLGPVSGATVFFATTAPATVSATLATSLETRYGCEVVATSNHLADRRTLRDELKAAPAFDVLLVELKAAAVDVAARMADEAGTPVVFCDNRPEVIDSPPEAFTEAVQATADLADHRFADSVS